MTLSIDSLETRENPSGLWQQLAADVRTLAQGTVPPSSASVTNFVNTYQSAVSDGVITARESMAIYNAGLAVLNSANIPVSEVKAVAADLKAIYAVWVG
jgi:2-keto-3-deoxy-6-phosphogluconate aldolase